LTDPSAGKPENTLHVIEASSTVRLELDNRPESPALVRAALSGVAERLRLDAELSDDLRIAVTEACNNVVLHAYDGKPGPLVVDLEIQPTSIEVMIRDWGGGIKQLGSQRDQRMGVGLAVMSSLADRAEFISAPDGGTEVRLVFSGEGLGIQPLEQPLDADVAAETPVRLFGDMVATLAPVELLEGVLGRVAIAVGARAHFSVDGLSDIRLVTDAVAAIAKGAASGVAMTFGVVARSRRLELTLGPVQAGSGASLHGHQADGLFDQPGTQLALLLGEVSTVPVDGFELLRVVVEERGPAPGG